MGTAGLRRNLHTSEAVPPIRCGFGSHRAHPKPIAAVCATCQRRRRLKIVYDCHGADFCNVIEAAVTEFRKTAVLCGFLQKRRRIERAEMTYASIGTFLSAPEQRSIFAIFEKLKIFGKNRSAAKIPSNRTNEIAERIKHGYGNRHRQAHEKPLRRKQRAAGNHRKCALRRMTGNESK